GERESVAGEHIRLALDFEIQQLAENVLNNEPGAVVVLDPRSGDILALASGPSMDRNALASRAAWQELMQDPQRPALNRAISGQYPPGSVFKPLVALAGLVNERISGETVFPCPGYYAMGGIRFRCWLRRGHGALPLRAAIAQSCNPYFIETAVRTGHQRIYHMADSVGFGRLSGIDLPGEVAGLLPDDTWKRRERDDAWRPGDTANVSIGQGALLVTPLQMALFTAALANGGRVYRPRLFLDDAHPPIVQQQMAWTPAHLGLVQAGMFDVIHGERGTGRRALIPGVHMAGKTGTAQFGQDQTHAWMILFAPYEAPRYAVAMIVEDDISGGVIVAPRLRALMEAIFTREGLIVPAEPPVRQAQRHAPVGEAQI
ncbi:MAG: penicillin-binding transpeptidase domain-containing protein, partial [Kiritimatiellia bacterium]